MVGPHSQVSGHLSTFWRSGSIRIGEWCYVGEGSRIWSQAQIEIGNHVLISHLVDIHDTNSHPLDWRARRLDSTAIMERGRDLHPSQTECGPVTIEDDAWIGFKATILKNVRIGRGAIVAAGAVVTHDVAPWTIVAGNPARVVRTLDTGNPAINPPV
jgi:maltose O-acetyltransferase